VNTGAFRPPARASAWRSPHSALTALDKACVNFVPDVDIRVFFDSVDGRVQHVNRIKGLLFSQGASGCMGRCVAIGGRGCMPSKRAMAMGCPTSQGPGLSRTRSRVLGYEDGVRPAG
jgi:hypothetical protein